MFIDIKAVFDELSLPCAPLRKAHPFEGVVAIRVGSCAAVRNVSRCTWKQMPPMVQA